MNKIKNSSNLAVAVGVTVGLLLLVITGILAANGRATSAVKTYDSNQDTENAITEYGRVWGTLTHTQKINECEWRTVFPGVGYKYGLTDEGMKELELFHESLCDYYGYWRP